MKFFSLVCASLALSAVACGGEPPAQDPSTTNAQVATPAPAADMPAPAAEPVKPAKLEPLTKPASSWQTNGKSLSEITGEELAAALKKAGWIKGTEAPITAALTGQYESMSIPLENAKKMKGTFKLIRPAAKPGEPETASQAVLPSKAADTLSKDTGASYYDEASDVFVSIELTEGGKAADAKKALDAVAKPGKAAVGTTAPAAPAADAKKK